MSERSERISKLLGSQNSRVAYIKAKLAVLVPAQIRTLRINSENPPMPYQRDLAQESELHQSRISMFETPGAANMTLETIAKIAAGLRVGVVVKFVPFSEMLRWENSFSPDTFNVTRLHEDEAFLNPESEVEGQKASLGSLDSKPPRSIESMIDSGDDRRDTLNQEPYPKSAIGLRGA
jgi:transcriptional regulator with XRE-family HTH domain